MDSTYPTFKEIDVAGVEDEVEQQHNNYNTNNNRCYMPHCVYIVIDWSRTSLIIFSSEMQQRVRRFVNSLYE